MKHFFSSLLLGIFFSLSIVVVPAVSLAAECKADEAFIRLTLLPQVSDDFYTSVRDTYGDPNLGKVKACNRINRKLVEIQCKHKKTFELRRIENPKPGDKCDLKNEDQLDIFTIDKRREVAIERAVQNRICYTHEDLGSYQLTNVDILGCATVTGDVRLWMVPYYIRYFSDFLIAISGSIAILVIIFGGYTYIVGSVGSESSGEESGKKIIWRGILGLIVILSAWTVVNVVLSLLTS